MSARLQRWAATPRRNGWRRYGASATVSLLLHVLVALLLLPWAADPVLTAEPEAAELSVPLEFDSEPLVPPGEQPPAPPAEADQAEQVEEETPAETPPDDSLLGFRSEGEIPARPDRPVGPEAEIRAPPPPGGGEPEVEQLPPRRELPETETPPEPVPPEEEREELAEPQAGEESAQQSYEPEREGAEARVEDAPTGPEPARVEGDAPRQLEVPPPVSPRRSRPQPSPRKPAPGPEGPGSSIDFDVDVHGGLFGDLNFDSPDYNWSDYSVKVYFAVYREWLRELLARARRFEREQKLENLPRLDDEVRIHFVINRDGSVSDLAIVGPGEIESLAEASSSALLRAVLPRLPADFPRDREGVTFRFILSIDNALQMERQLKYLRSRGEF